LALAGVAMLIAYFTLADGAPEQPDPASALEGVVADAIAPDLAVLGLAGEPDDRVVRAALDAGEEATAYAGLAYALLLSDGQRSGNWLLAGKRLGSADPTRARLAYRIALDHVALAPTLGDAARAELALQAGRGLAGLDRSDEALLAFQQAEALAGRSPLLLPSQRRALIQRTIDAYRDAGLDAEALRLAGEADRLAAGPGTTAPVAPPLLAELRGGVTLPAPVVSALAARQDAAARLAASWLSADDSGRDSLAAALGDALRREDEARRPFYEGIASLDLPDRLALLHDQAAWMTIKARAARRDYGLSLVPAWESETGEILSTLSTAYTELINGYGQQLDTLEPADASAARTELLRQALLWHRLGLFPGDVEDALAQQLIEASAVQGAMPIVEREAGGRRYFAFGPSSP
jgi:hypothetical protein